MKCLSVSMESVTSEDRHHEPCRKGEISQDCPLLKSECLPRTAWETEVGMELSWKGWMLGSRVGMNNAWRLTRIKV